MATPETTRRSALGILATGPLAMLPALAVMQCSEPANAGTDPSGIEAIFAQWKGAYLAANTSHPDDSAILKLLDQSEQRIFESAEQSPRVAEIHLWIALSHTLAGTDDAIAVGKEDAAYLNRAEADYDWPDRAIVRAIRALRGGVMQ